MVVVAGDCDLDTSKVVNQLIKHKSRDVFILVMFDELLNQSINNKSGFYGL